MWAAARYAGVSTPSNVEESQRHTLSDLVEIIEETDEFQIIYQVPKSESEDDQHNDDKEKKEAVKGLI